MPVNYFTRAALTSLFAVSAVALPAMTPEVKLPEWQRSKIDISEWKPDQKLLTLRIDIEAPNVQLEKISSQLHLPSELSISTGKHERSLLKKGDKVIFLHKISIKSGFTGWAEVELHAQPSQTELLALIKAKYAKEPVTGAILEAEALTINQPLFFGSSMPLLVRDDIALCTAAETSLKPDYKVAGNDFYLWYPETGFGRGLTSEGLKAFNSALAAGNLKTAESAGNMLIKKLESGKEPLMLERGTKETFAIPAPIAVDLIKANLITLKAVTEKNPDSLATLLNDMQPGYTKPFLMFNLASLYASQKKNDKARTWYEKAIEAIPAWPLAEKHMKALKK